MSFGFLADLTTIAVDETHYLQSITPDLPSTGAYEFVFTHQMSDGNELFSVRTYNESFNSTSETMEVQMNLDPSSNKIVDILGALIQAAKSGSLGSEYIDSVLPDSYYGLVNANPSSFGYRLTEVAAAKIVGYPVANVILNDTDYTGTYDADTSTPTKTIYTKFMSSLNTEGTKIYDTTDPTGTESPFSKIFRSYKEFNPTSVDVVESFNFQRSEWFFPISFSSLVFDEDGTTVITGAKPSLSGLFAGNRLDQGISILLYINAGP
jgi:hypothetical protein